MRPSALLVWLPQRLRSGTLAAIGPRITLALALACVAALAVLFDVSGIERDLRMGRDALHGRSASGQVVVVEIDAQSLNRMGRWPWPRRLHAQLVDRLVAAGATTIGFDIDFSSASNPEDDAALARAVRAAGGRVLLPTFRQASSLDSAAEVENLPIPALREAAMLVSVNVQPEANGQLVHYDEGTVTAGVPRPSLASMLAGTQGQVGRRFRIDSAIDPATIPMVSAVDVLQGRLADGLFRGKSVIIGGTAIEMGDRYAMPRHGVLPGVVAQALATETLLAGTQDGSLGTWPAIGVLALVLLLVPVRRKRVLALTRLGLLLALLGAPLALEAQGAMTIDIVPALGLLIADTLLRAATLIARQVDGELLTDAVTGLPNAKAFEAQVGLQGEVTVVAARLRWFEELDAVLDDASRRQLTARVIDRFRIAFPEADYHATAPGTIAWAVADVPAAGLAGQIEGLLTLFRAPIQLSDRLVLVTPSFGLCPGQGEAAHLLLAQAMLAAREAQTARKPWALHSDAAQQEAQKALTLLADLDSAIEAGEIFVVYQPKYAPARGCVTAAEALVRWKHPTLGAIPPDSFIPLLEASGNIERLTLAVLDRALAALAEFRRLQPGFGVSVNISASLLDDRAFVRQVDARIARAALPPGTLTFEITESAAIEHAAPAQQLLADWRHKGVRISIDDYGTGRATLSYLRAFPVDEVKIDKSFVTNMLTDENDRILVRSTVELGRQLDFEVVAEGAEDTACVAALAEYGCHAVQGWAIGRPVEADAFARLHLTNGASIAA